MRTVDQGDLSVLPPPPPPPAPYSNPAPPPPTISTVNLDTPNPGSPAQANVPSSGGLNAVTAAPPPPPPAPAPTSSAPAPGGNTRQVQSVAPAAPPPGPVDPTHPTWSPSSPTPNLIPPTTPPPSQPNYNLGDSLSGSGVVPGSQVAQQQQSQMEAGQQPTYTPSNPYTGPGSVPTSNGQNVYPQQVPTMTDPSQSAPPPSSTDPGSVFANDPVYQAAIQESQLAKKNAAGNYLESLKTLLLQFGDVNLAHQVLDGIGGQISPYTGSAPDLTSYFAQYANADNPDTAYTTLAQFNRSVREGMKNLVESLNSQGLYYSGAGAKAISDFQYQSQAKLNQLLNQTRQAVTQAGQEFFSRLQSAQASEISAMNDAYTRQVQAAMQGQFDLPAVQVPTSGSTGQTTVAAGKVPAPPKPPAKVATKPKVTTQKYSSPNYLLSKPAAKKKPTTISPTKRVSRG